MELWGRLASESTRVRQMPDTAGCRGRKGDDDPSLTLSAVGALLSVAQVPLPAPLTVLSVVPR